MKMKEISEKLGVSKTCIKYHIIKKTITPSRNNLGHYIFSEDDYNALIKVFTKFKRDPSLLGTIPDGELAKLWNISRERVRQLRIKLKIPNFKKPNQSIIKIINYLKTCKQPIILKELMYSLNIHKLGKKRITINMIQSIAKEHNIQCSFKKTIVIKEEHGNASYKKGCRCDICKLSNAICTYCCNHFKTFQKEFYDKMANCYIDLYRTDKTKYKSIFYAKIREEYEKYKLNSKMKSAIISNN